MLLVWQEKLSAINQNQLTRYKIAVKINRIAFLRTKNLQIGRTETETLNETLSAFLLLKKYLPYADKKLLYLNFFVSRNDLILLQRCKYLFFSFNLLLHVIYLILSIRDFRWYGLARRNVWKDLVKIPVQINEIMDKFQTQYNLHAKSFAIVIAFLFFLLVGVFGQTSKIVL